MALDSGSLGEAVPLSSRLIGRLRAAHQSWTQSGEPANLRHHALWIYGQEFDVLEDEVGVVEVRRHRGELGTYEGRGT
jgi:hypothetical protein